MKFKFKKYARRFPKLKHYPREDDIEIEIIETENNLLPMPKELSRNIS